MPGSEETRLLVLGGRPAYNSGSIGGLPEPQGIVMQPETKYAKSGDLSIAYQVVDPPLKRPHLAHANSTRTTPACSGRCGAFTVR